MPSVNEIMRNHGTRYRSLHKIPLNQIKAMKAISRCRTDELGWNVLECKECGKKQIRYHSCRNRHCPQCQGETRELWINKRKDEMLPVPYYHVIFTIPSELNPIVQQNQKEMFNILFRASAETLQELASDRKFLGAEIGFMSFLHTWGQNLIEHPHLHVLVPGGGISANRDYWLDVSHRKYFMPIHVLSRVFRGKFMDLFVQFFHAGKLTFFGEQAYLLDLAKFNKLKNRLYTKGWIVNVRPPFSTALTVLEYLSRYLNRVAISNGRIISENAEGVTFRWMDNRDGKEKAMKVSAHEFIRRFLLHILPERFVKIRYYGFLSNRNRRNNIEKCYQLITFRKKPEAPRFEVNDTETPKPGLMRPERTTTWICPVCNGKLGRCIIRESRHGPPI